MSNVTTEPEPAAAGDHHDAREGTDDTERGDSRMAWQLFHEVLHATGVQLTPSEHLVLLVIAEECHSHVTRTCQLHRAELAARAKITPDTVKTALQSLARKKLDPRVPIPDAFGSDGRPVYAYPGRPTTFRLPHLVDEPEHTPHGDPPAGDQDGDQDGKGGGSAPPPQRPPRPRKGGRSAPPPGRLDRAAIDACRYCDHNAQVLGIDGLVAEPPIRCNRHPVVIT